MNEDRPTLSAAKMQANESSFWKYKVHADSRGGFPGRGRQTTLGVVDDGNFRRAVSAVAELLVIVIL